MLNKLTILSLNSSQVKTFSFEYCSDIMHYPNKKISTTLEEVFRTVCKEWQLHFFCSWRIIIGAYFFFPGYCLLCVCVCVCVCYCDAVWNNIFYNCLSKKLLKMAGFTSVSVGNLHNQLCSCCTKYCMIWKSTDFSRHGYCSLYSEVVSERKEKCSKSNVQQYNKDLFSHFLDATGSE